MCGFAVVLMGVTVGACAGDCLCAVEWGCVGGVFMILSVGWSCLRVCLWTLSGEAFFCFGWSLDNRFVL